MKFPEHYNQILRTIEDWFKPVITEICKLRKNRKKLLAEWTSSAGGGGFSASNLEKGEPGKGFSRSTS